MGARVLGIAALLVASVVAGGSPARSSSVQPPVAEAAIAGDEASTPAAVVLAAAAPDSPPVAAQVRPLPDVKPALAQADLSPMKHIWQSLNNCGPAAVVMALSTLGVDVDQETARIPLRGENVLRGMGPQGVPGFVSQWSLTAMWRNGGTNDLLKRLISNGFAPLVTQWMQDPSYSRIAHWRTVRGYDDAAGVFYVNDSMLGNGVALPYRWFSDNWQPFSYRYMVIYRPEDEGKLRALVGEDWSDTKMREHMYLRTKDETLTRNDSASWLAYGEAAYQFGMFSEAVTAFDRGMALGSAQGVFTLRSSYPQALRALQRTQDADIWQAKLQNVTPVPATVAAEPDKVAVSLYEQRARVAALDALPLGAVRLLP